MAESAIAFVLQKFGDLLIEEVRFMLGVDGQLEQIRDELSWMQGFLKDVDAIQDLNNVAHLQIRDITKLAYDVEDVLETFVLTRKGGIRYILKRVVTRHDMGIKIQDIKSRISLLKDRLQIYGRGVLTDGQQRSSVSRFERERELRRTYSYFPNQEDFVGLEDDVLLLVGHLVNENEGHGVVSICGMGGLGKTTLAKKIYKDIKVKRHFDCFAWTCISQQWQTKTVWQSILTDLDPQKRDNIRFMSDNELVRDLNNMLTNKKCLIVIDDIWSTDAWDCLKPALQIGQKGSKILLTTRNKFVAEHVDREGFLHEPRRLTEDESWELLKKKAHLNEDVSESNEYKEKENLGKKMLTHCGGLPLGILVLGGMLVSKSTHREWEKVCVNIESKGFGQQHNIENVLALSYFDLPYQLKPCFIYLGTFPEDSKIEVEKLCHLLIAEGLILSRDRVGDETMTKVAERYLHELAQRGMISLQEGPRTGRYWDFGDIPLKYCQLHDLMRDLFLSKAKEQNFFDYVAENDDVELEEFSPSRRLVITFMNDATVVQIKARSRYLRSLTRHYNRYWDTFNYYLGNLKFLRVLVLEQLGLENTSSSNAGIGKLVYLRYLSLRGSRFDTLPSSIGNLEQLQTLDLRTSDGSFVPKNLLRKMRHLRHLYLPDRIETHELRLDCKNLETLENFDNTKCDVKNLSKSVELRKLSATVEYKQQDLECIVDWLTGGGSRSITPNHLQHLHLSVKYDFQSEDDHLDLLQKLVSIHCLDSLRIDGIICKLPEHRHFSTIISKIWLEECELKDDPMKTLEKLPNLRDLVLNTSAMVVEEMTCSAMGFPKLESLLLIRLGNLQKWMVEEGALPFLHFLQIIKCSRLEEIPDGLRFVTCLQTLSIDKMPLKFCLRLMVERGQKGEDLEKVEHVPSIDITHVSY